MKSVPFYANYADNLRCLPACLRMALHAIEGRDPGAETTEKLAGFCPGRPTWNFRAYRTCAERGILVNVIENTDIARFSEDPLQLLIETFGAQDAANIAAKTDLKAAANDARALCSNIPNFTFKKRIPTPSDLEKELSEGAVVICGVDLRVLAGKAPGADHGVICLGMSANEVVLHDPGLPPLPNRHVPRDRFMAAWSTPNNDARWLMSLRRKSLEHL